jgi:hypothetical protein
VWLHTLVLLGFGDLECEFECIASSQGYSRHRGIDIKTNNEVQIQVLDIFGGWSTHVLDAKGEPLADVTIYRGVLTVNAVRSESA